MWFSFWITALGGSAVALTTQACFWLADHRRRVYRRQYLMAGRLGLLTLVATGVGTYRIDVTGAALGTVVLVLVNLMGLALWPARPAQKRSVRDVG